MISYSSITDCPKLNLDQVDDWYITNNILKDPPKGFSTRRIIKVGDNNELLSAIDSSLDRNDAIRQYATRVNPMVSTSYNNTTGNTQAFLPYRIAKDGAFRPPILYQQDLLPLSRLPRYTTSLNTSAEWIDYSKWERPSEDSKKFTQIARTVHITPLTAPLSSNKVTTITNFDRPQVNNYIENKPSLGSGKSHKLFKHTTDQSWYKPQNTQIKSESNTIPVTILPSIVKPKTDTSWYNQQIKLSQKQNTSANTNLGTKLATTTTNNNNNNGSYAAIRTRNESSAVTTNFMSKNSSTCNLPPPIVTNQISKINNLGSFKNIGTISRF